MSAQTLLFLGSTGGCTNAILTHALLAGQNCIALVRSPDKLIDKLKTDQGLSDAQISAHLTTVPGDAKSIPDLKTALLAASTLTTTTTNGSPPTPSLPNTIITGLGATGNLTWEFCHPLQIVKPSDPTLCRDSAAALTTALREIYTEHHLHTDSSHPYTHTDTTQPALPPRKPHLIFISTTGVTRGPEDVPLAMRFMYHQMLAQPHEDKKAMEDVFRADAEKQDEDQKVFASVSGVRPTLLSGTGQVKEGKGVGKVKAGTEGRPAVGYGIMRGEVGGWVWENLVHGGGGRGEKGRGAGRWVGEMCSLTT